MSVRFGSFYLKISLVFLGLVLFLGAAEYRILDHFWTKALRGTDQQLHWKLAKEIAEEFAPFLKDPIQEAQIKQKMLTLKRFNPRLDVFILTASGRIEFALPISWAPVVRHRIDTREIKRFVDSTIPDLPAYGPNPRNGDGISTFSAAAIQIGSNEGYIYLLLQGPSEYNYSEVVTHLNRMVGSSVTTVVLVGVTALLGFVVFFFLTRRFRNLTATVHLFAEGDMTKRINDGNDDELGRLGREFDQMADTIVEKIKQLELTDRQRRELSAHVSHDLSGPLTSIQGYLETISGKYDQFSDEQKLRFVGVAQKNVQTLVRLVDDLFELSKLEAPDLQLKRQLFSTHQLIHEQVVAKAAVLAEEFGISLDTDIADNLPEVNGDPELIERVLNNLVQNAIRYCTEGDTVTVRARADSNGVRLAVSDNGPGIAPEQLVRIFDAFYRASQQSEKKRRGTGLGLAIVKRIVEAHDGTVSVESEVGSGTTFSFHLPVD